MDIIDLKYKASLKTSSIDKNQLVGSVCSLTISIDQEKQQGERLYAIYQAITESCFKKCYIMLCDTLQRYNLPEYNKHDQIKAHELALTLGDKWIENNRKHLTALQIPYQLLRWDYWINRPEYSSMKKTIDDKFDTCKKYRYVFYQCANTFAKRLYNRNYKNIEYEAIINNSIQYLKEECAVMLIWAKEGYNFEIYPSKRIEVMDATYKYIISKNIEREVLKPISIDIRSRKPKCKGHADS